MSETAVLMDAEDVAWASLNTPLNSDELKLFCRDIERLFRINPMLEFSEWQALGTNEYAFSGKNSSQETPFDFSVKCTVREQADGFRLDYSQGLKSNTTFKIEPAPQGSKLTIIDCYDGLSEEERKSRLAEVDKSIVVWASYLQKFIISWHRWSRLAPWRWYMRRVWQPMKPTARRISYMLVWISLFEIALIALGVAIYFSEYA
jgi:hypothetical protein